MISHLSWESCLPGMSISNSMFPNKEEIVWTVISQGTQHILSEGIAQSRSVLLGTKSEIRPSIFTVFVVFLPLGPLHIPDAIASEGIVSPMVKRQM